MRPFPGIFRRTRSTSWGFKRLILPLRVNRRPLPPSTPVSLQILGPIRSS
uniref:Uncharacterized protein n=1 Tax=Hyaloperonospora arabidopsidis (strain Emoy2) TaxID=559515 RepID=M4C5V2_HYAAE